MSYTVLNDGMESPKDYFHVLSTVQHSTVLQTRLPLDDCNITFTGYTTLWLYVHSSVGLSLRGYIVLIIGTNSVIVTAKSWMRYKAVRISEGHLYSIKFRGYIGKAVKDDVELIIAWNWNQTYVLIEGVKWDELTLWKWIGSNHLNSISKRSVQDSSGSHIFWLIL